MAFRTRIRAVRFKSGGEIRLLPSAAEAQHAKVIGDLSDAVELYRDLYAGELSGYALVVWDYKGVSSVAHATSPNGNPIGDHTLAAFVAGRIRASLVDTDAAKTVRKFLDLPDPD